MIVPPFVGPAHEQTILPHEDPCEVHRLVDTVRRSISLETIDADLGRRVEIPTGLRPQRLDVTVVTSGLAAEEFITPSRRCGIEVDSRIRRGRRNRKFIEMKRRQFLRYPILL